MISPRDHWAILVDVTTACPRNCANCHRLVPHYDKPCVMSVEQFRQAVRSLRDYVLRPGNPEHWSKGIKKIGIFGGDPLMHPELDKLLRVFEEENIPQQHRALWTGMVREEHKFADDIQRVMLPHGYISVNQHNLVCMHQPMLVAVQELVDAERQAKLIEQCPVQRYWSSSVTPKGYFFCEMAGAMDSLFHGPGGKPIEPGMWDHEIGHYQDQIDRWCHRCGMCAPLPGRLDKDEVDDISPGNLAVLRAINSPRVADGRYRVFDTASYNEAEMRKTWDPLRYFRLVEETPREPDIDYGS